MSIRFVTVHTRGSWLPNRKEGSVKHGVGFVAPNANLGAAYLANMNEPPVHFSAEEERVALEAFLEKCRYKGWEPHGAGSEPSHVHGLLDAPPTVSDADLEYELKRGMSYRLNERFGKRKWWSEGGNVRLARTTEKLAFYRDDYIPSHSGWIWHAEHGWRAPTKDQRPPRRT